VKRQEIEAFQATVWDYFADFGRHDLPWREPETDSSFDPYKIMVSELMLQQTQVSRVRQKYAEFLDRFPTVQSLARVDLGDVLVTWQGLGYNRRAKFLWQAAKKIVHDFDGIFPETLAELETLPGVGKNTAGAIIAYAFDKPVVFIETNIRTVYIHHFFHNQTDVSDKAILESIAATLPRAGQASHVRHWYWALMDYGTHLKQTVGNLSRASKSYAKQSKFEGSLRQIRGHVLRVLGQKPMTIMELSKEIADERLTGVLISLEREELIRRRGQTYGLFQM
jgi:A/G-specific adenine glycosylase